MVTHIRALDQGGNLVDEFSHTHTMESRRHLFVFVSLHYSLHPNGCLECETSGRGTVRCDGVRITSLF